MEFQNVRFFVLYDIANSEQPPMPALTRGRFRVFNFLPPGASRRVLGLFVGFEFVNQPHFLLNYATNNVSNISTRSVCQVLNLVL